MLWSQEVWSQGSCEAKSFHPRWWGQAIGHLAARPRRWSWLEEVEKPAEPRLRAAGSSRGWGAVPEAWVWCRRDSGGGAMTTPWCSKERAQPLSYFPFYRYILYTPSRVQRIALWQCQLLSCLIQYLVDIHVFTHSFSSLYLSNVYYTQWL